MLFKLIVLILIILVLLKIFKKNKENFIEQNIPIYPFYNPFGGSRSYYRTSIVDPWHLPPIRRTFYYRGYMYPYGVQNWLFWRNNWPRLSRFY